MHRPSGWSRSFVLASLRALHLDQHLRPGALRTKRALTPAARTGNAGSEMGHAVELSASDRDPLYCLGAAGREFRLIEAWTMTRSGPLPQDVVGRVLEDHRRGQRERAEPSPRSSGWRRRGVNSGTVLNVLNRVLEP